MSSEQMPDFFVHARAAFTTGEPDWQVSRSVRAGQLGGGLSFVLAILNSLHILWHGYEIEAG